jgi:hypothetical protein
MTDSTDTPKSSSERNRIAVAEPLAGMLVAGYVVIVFPDDTAKRSAFYGAFDTLDEALDWADLLSGIVTVHPIYKPTMNRG